MKKLLMIAAMAMFATVACSDKTDEVDPPVVGAPKATIVAAPASVAVDAAGAFNVTLDKAAEAEVVITVTNGGTDFLTVAATEIKIAKGATTGSVAFNGKAEGSAKVTFAANAAADLQTKELTVTVTKDAPVGVQYKEYPESGWGTYGGIVSAKVGEITINAGTEFVDDANVMDLGHAKSYFNKFVATPLVPFAAGSKLIVTFSTAAVYEGTEGSGTKGYFIDAYADWNNDGKFAAGERIGVKEVTGDDTNQTVEFEITAPETAAASSRVRVIYAANEPDEGAYVANEYMDSGAILEFMYTK